MHMIYVIRITTFLDNIFFFKPIKSWQYVLFRMLLERMANSFYLYHITAFYMLKKSSPYFISCFFMLKRIYSYSACSNFLNFRTSRIPQNNNNNHLDVCFDVVFGIASSSQQTYILEQKHDEAACVACCCRH